MDTEKVLVMDCTFGDIDEAHNQPATLQCMNRTVTFRTGEDGASSSGPFTVFAGLRRDPFFMDVRRDVATRATRRLAFMVPGSDALAGQNCLSIVIEFDAAVILGAEHPALWAATAETVSVGSPAARFERIGRPEAKNVLLAVNGNDTVNASVDLRDLYNLEDAFALNHAAAEVFQTRFDANLALMDQLDGDIAWPLNEDGRHPLTETFVNDYLVLDATKPFHERGYFDIERSLLTGIPCNTAGGRWLNEDVIDALYTLTVGGWDGPIISDGVDAASVPAGRQFPFLAAPNPHPPVPDPGVPIGPS